MAEYCHFSCNSTVRINCTYNWPELVQFGLTMVLNLVEMTYFSTLDSVAIWAQWVKVPNTPASRSPCPPHRRGDPSAVHTRAEIEKKSKNLYTQYVPISTGMSIYIIHVYLYKKSLNYHLYITLTFTDEVQLPHPFTTKNWVFKIISSK